MTISDFVEALTVTLTKPPYLSKYFWYYDHHHQHDHHHHHHYGHYTIGIITISPGLTIHTYTHNWWAAGSWFHQKIWVGDMLSPRSNFLTFLHNLTLQLITPWAGHLVRSRCGGCNWDWVHTAISTNIIILATICHPPPTPTTSLLVRGGCNSACLWMEHPDANIGAYSQVRLGVSCLLRVNLEA